LPHLGDKKEASRIRFSFYRWLPYLFAHQAVLFPSGKELMANQPI
jgi:hypothetical protein